MLSDDTKRPNYRDGQYLLPADFIAEQRYHTDLRRRLSLGQHTWGIFVGLDLLEQPREDSTTAVDVFVTPGIGVDGFGRELVVYEPYKLEAELFLQPIQPAGWVPVWIRYAPELTDPPRYGYELCDDPDNASRTRETFRIEVGDRPKPHDDIVIAGKPVLDADLPVVDASIPYQALPEDADDDRWLVPLGYANWDGTSGFVKSSTPDDDKQRAKGRVYGGVVSAHTYAPADTWELIARRTVPAGDPEPRAAGVVHGSLTVEDLIVAKNDGLQLYDSPITFLDKDGKDQGRPIFLSRADKVGGADLRVQIGSGGTKENRLVVAASQDERVVVYDDGSIDVTGNLDVKGIVDLGGATGDRIVLSGDPDEDETAAIGTESGGDVLFARANDELRWYVGQKPDNGPSARMLLDDGRLAIRGNAIVGAGGKGILKVRQVDGKDWKSDADDDLYLNWSTSQDVHVGGGNPASLRVSKDLTVGAGGSGHLRTRHVDGKEVGNDSLDDLYLQWDTGKNVIVGRASTPADLIVNGGIFIGNTPLPVAIDVQVGREPVNKKGSDSGSLYITVTSIFATVSEARFVPSLGDIENVNVANDARWSVRYADYYEPLGASKYRFLVHWEVGDSDGWLNDIAWVAIFVP